MPLKVQESIKCYHCGETIKENYYIHKVENTEYHFCCNGCLQAYLFIRDLGLNDYYKHREDYASKPEFDYIEEALYDYIENELKSKLKSNVLEKTFYIKGIHCASCVWINEKVLGKLEGVIEAQVSLSTNRVQIKWDSNKISLKEIGNTIYKIGYVLVPINEKNETPIKSYSDTLLKKMAVAGFFMGNNMLISASLYAGYFDFMDPVTKFFFHWMSFFLTIPVYFYSASEFFKSSYVSLKNKVIATDLLTSVGISLAFFYSIYITITNQLHREVFFDAINFVVFVILIGRFIESRLKLKTWYYKNNLNSINPEVVKTLKNHHLILRFKDKTVLKVDENYSLKNTDFEYKKLEEVQEKEIIIVSPQEIVPLDSILLNSKAEVDESSLTGEFKSILKHYKDLIVSGSKNISNTILFLEVKHNYKQSTISRILELADRSLLNKSRYETISTKISSIFIVLVLTLGLMTFLYWCFFKQDLSNAILFTLSLLIVACPCALSLSIPTAMIVGLQELFSKGCLVQNSQLLETIAKSKVIAFDKTGTLTQGNLNIYKIYSKVELLYLKNIINLLNNYQRELQIQHPISKAFYKLEQENNNQIIFHLNRKIDLSLENQNFQAKYYPGLGLKLSSDTINLWLGSESWLKSFGYRIDYNIKKEKGDILVLLGYESPQEKIIFAYFLLKDQLKENVEVIIPKLNLTHKTILLTGDNEENATWIQEKTQIQKIYFSLKPEDKAKIIQEYQKHNQRILMIGDGINDTIALKQADAGISFITASNLALYSADIFLLNPDMKVIYFLVNFTKLIFRKIKQNLTMSLVYNLILLPMAFLGYLSPFVGAVFMSLSSITVVLNSLSIKKYKTL